MIRSLTVICFAMLCATSVSSAAVELRQVISREHPAIQGTGQGLAIGRDGSVLIYGSYDQGGYVLRISRDGSQKFGITTTYAITGVAGRDDGLLATSNAHFAKSVSVYDPRGKELGKVGGFTGNDQVGWDGPGCLEVGSSGDFFALDQHAGRIVRINAAGEMIRSYPLPDADQLKPARVWSYGFRLNDDAEQFYFLIGNEIRCHGFDGKHRWSVPASIGGDPWGGFSGGFDVDDAGRLFVSNGVDPTVRLFARDGNPAGEVTLEMRDRAPGPQRRISHLRIFENDLIVRQKSDTEVFQVYDSETGAFRRAVSIDHEQMTVAFPEPVWIAGTKIPLAIKFEASDRPIQPRLEAWLRPLGTENFTQLEIAEGQAEIPADGAGLYQLRIGSGLDGQQSEYGLETVVEIRPANAVGSVSIFTPHNRRWYRRGEKIAGEIKFRTKDGTAIPSEIELELVDEHDKLHHQLTVAVKGSAATWQLAEDMTVKLDAGDYRLTTSLPNWTVATQFLRIGTTDSAAKSRPFYRVRHGDYSSAYPAATFWNAPEQIDRHLTFSLRIGENLYVDRLGHSGSGGLGEVTSTLRDSELSARLQADPIAVTPEKAEFENRILQTVAAYGAFSIEQRAILMYMDAGLPVGTLFDKRPPEEMARDLQTVTKQLADYPAFRGWSWAANWWLEKRGADLAANPEERATYEAAMKAANETGQWDPVIETVSNRWVEQAAIAEKQFRTAMDEVGKQKLVSAMTAPYRQPGMIPPLTFANADEMDLHFQSEQIQWPMISAHNVDFYKRPGKPAWGHPELWNDDGTGGQILSDSLQMVMRGADGVGQSGSVKGFVSADADPRSMGPGATSIHRQLNRWLAANGAWLASSQPRDPIAIPLSTRMLRMELGWQGIGGFYFTRLFEAYNACLRAHRPASFVFAEDCEPDSFNNFKGILLVSQTVGLEPSLQAALKAAVQTNVPIYIDKTCRAELLTDLSPRLLDIDFTHVEKDHHVLNDDGAFWRFREYMLDHAKTLNEAWKDMIPPIAICDNPEVLLTERQIGDVKLLWVVNDAAVPIEPGQLWRVNLAAGSRLPVKTEIKWPAAQGKEVFELFSSNKQSSSQPLTADLRHAPARLYAIRATSTAEIPGLSSKSSRREPFGPRIRDLVVSDDQKYALATVAGWDRNAFVIDLMTGNMQSQQKIGHHFAYAPLSTSAGFAVQGYDLNSAEGYHLYLCDPQQSSPERRFALYGLPKRGTSWAGAKQWQEPINQFAVSPDGSWVAAAGDLGLAVWSRDGQKLWSDDWWRDSRQRRRLFAPDARTLLAIDGSLVTAVEARTSVPLWTNQLGETGQLTAAAASTDGTRLALKSTAEGGRIFILQHGGLANTLMTRADEMALSPDGRYVAVTNQHELRLYDTAGGLLWSAACDDVLRSPRFNPQSDRIAVGSELGTLYVFDLAGQKLLERDFQSLPVAAWLNDGGLVVGNWQGVVKRLGSEFDTPWQTAVQSDAEPSQMDWLAKDPTPTVRVTGWGNAAPEAAPLTPNLLTETQAILEVRCEPTTHGDPRTWQHKVDLLRDGDPTPPATPWLEWTDISYLDSGWRSKLIVQADTFRSQVRLKGVTIVEDAQHPESWTRDTRLQWWDATSEAWRDGPYLLFEGPASPPEKTVAHTHWFETPLEAAKFRFVSTGGASWPVGNLRWGELVFHGDVLGPSHPDAVANRPVAVLFDEREDTLKNLMAYGDYPFAFRYDDAASGGKCLALTKAGVTTPHWKPPFGHVLPNWDFTIVETPAKPGEYRWLEFAWKAASKETTGVTLRVGPHHGEGVAVSAGEASKFEGAVVVEEAKSVPADWLTVRIDLWKTRGAFAVRSLSLGSVGGGALFDKIRLARTEKDLIEP